MVMAMKRTTVFADEDDLAIIKAAAARRGVAEAELLRDAVHLVAMAHRTWSEPFFSRTYASDEESPRVGVDEAMDAAWSEKADDYERTKRPAS